MAGYRDENDIAGWLQNYSASKNALGGLLEAGNIDLNNRPRVQNPDGSISTVRSMSFGRDGHEYLVPTVSDSGTILTDEGAMDLFDRTGHHLGIFDTPENATRYADKLHRDQEAKYAQPLRDDSAGPYGQWTNDPNQSWGDYLKMLGMDAGEGAYNALANITGGLSPIGTSPEGNMALQVPPMVSGLYDSAKRIGERGGFTRVEEFDAPLKQDLANALLTFYGGNALAGVAKPRGALGAGAMREAGGLPMDHASRMARAKEMGFDTEAPTYRGIRKPYSEDEAAKMHYQMFTSSPREAAEYGSNVIEAYLKRGRNLSVDAGGRNFNAVPTEGLEFTGLGPYARTDEIAHKAKAAGYDSVTFNNIFDNATDVKGYAPKPTPRPSRISDEELLAELGITPEDLAAAQTQSIADVQAPIQPWERRPTTVEAIFDPRNIRSVNAAFDPARAGENGLLLSDNKPSIFGASLATAGERKNALKNVLGTPDYEAFRAGLEQMPKSQIMEILDGTVSGLTPSVSKAKMLERIDDVQRVKAGFDLKIKAMGNRTAG